jgi:hypothetical protein
MIDPRGGQFVVSSIELFASGEWLLYGKGRLGNEFAKLCHHYKPPTVEDMLEEYRIKYYNLVTNMGITSKEYERGIKELTSEYADKLQLRKDVE